MAREIPKLGSLPEPRFRYSPCVKAGPHYQFAGMIGFDPGTGKLAEGGPGAETRRILANFQAGLGDLGLGLDDLVAATIYTTRFDLFPEINAAWEEVFRSVTPPARTAVGVVALPLGATVEMEFRLYRPDETGEGQGSRE